MKTEFPWISPDDKSFIITRIDATFARGRRARYFVPRPDTETVASRTRSRKSHKFSKICWATLGTVLAGIAGTQIVAAQNAVTRPLETPITNFRLDTANSAARVCLKNALAKVDTAGVLPQTQAGISSMTTTGEKGKYIFQTMHITSETEVVSVTFDHGVAISDEYNNNTTRSRLSLTVPRVSGDIMAQLNAGVERGTLNSWDNPKEIGSTGSLFVRDGGYVVLSEANPAQAGTHPLDNFCHLS